MFMPEGQDGHIARRDLRTGQQRSIRPEGKPESRTIAFMEFTGWWFPRTTTRRFTTAEIIFSSPRTAVTIGRGSDVT